jgi:amino-acid N-acetyltransferase
VVIVPVGYTQDSQIAVPVPADDVVLALAKELAGLESHADATEDPDAMARRIDKLQKEVSLDRLIVLDPLGGIPALNQRPHKSHLFINLEQEYDDIVYELTQGMESGHGSNPHNRSNDGQMPVSSLGRSNPFSQFVESELVSLPRELQSLRRLADQGRDSAIEGHLSNLNLLQHTLSYLPASSSGIITRPQDAANSARTPQDHSSFSAVGTRRQRNPLIHNLLTDKPLHSPSLPLGRLGVKKGAAVHVASPITPATFVKKGMPLTVLPDPRVRLWTAANDGQPRIRLDDARIDLPRLFHLIEDSFDRKLDVQHYMNRVNDRIAGLIIAGEYEGGAILTWENPPGVVDDGSNASLSRMVPYLDKFAVLKRSQGAGGVADIVFNAMVRSCFPRGVCWRSRQDNPVNKWYFERARGTWKLADTNWTMFWTTEGVPENKQVFQDYEGVCRGVEPSWADNKSVVD